jgi:hypothetical protein
MPAIRLSLFDRFMSKVRQTDNCWIWLAGTKGGGYGSFNVGSRKSERAHRVAWTIFNGPIPSDKCVLHKCDNRRCVKPQHLFLGTIGENNHDRHAKGRDGDHRGVRNGRAKLKPEDVLVILESETSARSLAAQLGVSLNLIHKIRQRTLWKHIA